MKRLLHVGIDVDDKSFHVCAVSAKGTEHIEFRCRATNGALIRRLDKLKDKGYRITTCHEASYLGFSLHRYLESKGIKSTIVAPSLIPELPGKKVKTDRRDAKFLARYFAKGLLTAVNVLSEEDEQARDVIRSRAELVKHRSRLRMQIISATRTLGLDYKQESGNKTYWTKAHIQWLNKKMEQLNELSAFNIHALLQVCHNFSEMIHKYDEKIEILSLLESYKASKDALCCLRGVSTLTAMTMITEIGDVRRFAHPSALTSYAGLDVSEYSSGGKEKKFGITKQGNRRIRTAAVESCQRAGNRCYISKRLKAARKGQPDKVVAIADKCMSRLRKKSLRLQYAGKHVNKVKVACAREFLCFTWAILREVA